MTGCGEAHHAEDGVSYSVAIRTFNNRYLKTSIKLPETLQFLEDAVDKQLRGALGRGSVIYQLRTRDQRASAAYGINLAALQAYVDEVGKVQMPQGVTASIDLGTLTALPGVCQTPEPDESTLETEVGIVQGLTREALEQTTAMRRQEGLALCENLTSNCDAIRVQLGIIAEQAPNVVAEYHERLKKRVAVLLNQAKLEMEQDTLAREVAIYADRCDIHEELTRLGSHLDQFAASCENGGLVGRKLEFLVQEMLRETNTIGSKSNDVAIVRAMVETKSLLDRLKEQLLNVC